MENLVGIFAISAFGIVTAQFQNPFSAMMNTGTGSTNNATGCGTRINSCAPWCSKSLDANGCMVCSCQNGGMRPMGGINPMSGGINPMSGGMNPMSGGMNPMGMNPMNQMSQMFPGLTGGSSPMTGNVQKQGQTACSPAPTTCPVPQPWCERIADGNGCIKCLCGKELVAYVQGLNGQTTQSVQKPLVTSTSSTVAPIKSTVTVTHAPKPTNRIQSCLETFYCTKICDYGYRTDSESCPLCECLDNSMVDLPVDATDPPGKFTLTPPTTSSAPIVTDHVTACPGIFDCAIICNNGYKTDALGCPVCSCEK